MTAAASNRFPVYPPGLRRPLRAGRTAAPSRRSMEFSTRRIRLLGSLILGTSLLTACTGPLVRQHTGSVSSTAQAMPGEADTLASAALQAWAERRNTAQALALIRRAVQHDENRPDLVWLQIRLCAEADGCDPTPFETRLRRLDPANGVVWLGALGRAEDRLDNQAAASLLDAMSRVTGFDLYWTTLVRRLTLALNAAHGPMSGADGHAVRRPDDAVLTGALNDITGWLSRLDTPAFGPLTTACSPPRAHATGTVARCISIATIMQGSDTALAEALGLGIAQRLAAPGSPQAAALDRRIDVLRYRTQGAVAIMEGQNEREKFSAEILDLMKNLRREQDVTGTILRWAGHPLDPQQ
ncbi:hypothetical protein [Steroidobacter denitrificans]|nr:hypothetical protein [Steroidobacter denitrificans]